MMRPAVKRSLHDDPIPAVNPFFKGCLIGCIGSVLFFWLPTIALLKGWL